jgi:hypothetical protein
MLYSIRAIRGYRKREQVGATALDIREEAKTIVLKGDIAGVEIEELWKVDVNMSNVVRVTADLLRE